MSELGKERERERRGEGISIGRSAYIRSESSSSSSVASSASRRDGHAVFSVRYLSFRLRSPRDNVRSFLLRIVKRNESARFELIPRPGRERN